MDLTYIPEHCREMYENGIPFVLFGYPDPKKHKYKEIVVDWYKKYNIQYFSIDETEGDIAETSFKIHQNGFVAGKDTITQMINKREERYSMRAYMRLLNMNDHPYEYDIYCFEDLIKKIPNKKTLICINEWKSCSIGENVYFHGKHSVALKEID